MRSWKECSEPQRLVHLQREDHVGLSDDRAAERHVERVPRGEIHSPEVVDNSALQGFGEFDQARHAGRGSGHAIANDHGIFRRHQHLGEFGKRRVVALRRDDPRKPRNTQRVAFRDRVFLQLGIERQHHRRHRRRHRDLVGAHRRLGEMLQRGRLIVPFDEITDHGARIDRRMHPFSAGAALVGLDDIAAHDDDGHPVAPGVVHRHRGVLQANHAVANHGHRLALDLGVALRHMDRDFLVRTGQDFRPGVAAVIDDRFMKPAETRGAIHGEIVDVECLEDIDHEIPATRTLADGVRRRRHGFGRSQLRSRRLRLHPFFVEACCCRIRARGRRGQRGGASQCRAFEEIASVGIG
jgi:hypothetical protein